MAKLDERLKNSGLIETPHGKMPPFAPPETMGHHSSTDHFDQRALAEKSNGGDGDNN